MLSLRSILREAHLQLARNCASAASIKRSLRTTPVRDVRAEPLIGIGDLPELQTVSRMET